MSAPDPQTIAAYDSRAAAYSDLVGSGAEDRQLARFLSTLPPGAHVLDLGCGPGQAAAEMQAQGFTVTAMDPSPAMIREGRARHGVEIRQAGFDDLVESDRYDAVWAAFSLLHAPRAALPGHLARIRRALRPGGRFALAMKLGAGERRDSLGRFYTYYSETELRDLVTATGFAITVTKTGEARGLEGHPEPWILFFADG